LRNRQEKSLFSDGRNRQKKWITDKEIKFLGGAKPTSYYIIYPDGLHTVKKSLFSCRCLFSLSISSHQGNIFFLVGGDFPVERGPSGNFFSLSVLNRQEKSHRQKKN